MFETTTEITRNSDEELLNKYLELTEDEKQDIFFNILNGKFEDRKIVSGSYSWFGILTLNIQYNEKPESVFQANIEVKKELKQILGEV